MNFFSIFRPRFTVRFESPYWVVDVQESFFRRKQPLRLATPEQFVAYTSNDKPLKTERYPRATYLSFADAHAAGKKVIGQVF